MNVRNWKPTCPGVCPALFRKFVGNQYLGDTRAASGKPISASGLATFGFASDYRLSLTRIRQVDSGREGAGREFFAAIGISKWYFEELPGISKIPSTFENSSERN